MKNILFLLLLAWSGNSFAATGNSDGAAAAGMFLGLAFLFCLIVLYFIPTAVAQYRKSVNMTTVVLVNIFLGWTVIGWIVALIIAFAGDSGAQVQRHKELIDALNKNNQNKNP